MSLRHGGAQWDGTYAQQLTADDLALLAQAGRVIERSEEPIGWLRGRPDVVEDLLAHPRTFEAVFGVAGNTVEPFLRASPFLVFAVAVQRAREDLRHVSFVQEWVGPRQRVPVLGVTELRDFLDDRLRRLFLVELLGSYTHVTSGSMWVQTRRGWRRQRYSELDLVRLASLLETLPPAEHSGVYRRLGDLTLFLTGVFPDHTAEQAFRPIDVARLWRAVQRPGSPEPLLDALASQGAVALLGYLGQQWYRLAAETTTGPLSGSLRVVEEMTQQYEFARRTLNYVTDQYLFPLRSRWFPAAGAHQ